MKFKSIYYMNEHKQPSDIHNVQYWYHGSTDNIGEFHIQAPRKRTILMSEIESHSRGIFLATNASDASQYGNLIYECSVNVGNVMDPPIMSSIKSKNNYSDDEILELFYIFEPLFEYDEDTHSYHYSVLSGVGSGESYGEIKLDEVLENYKGQSPNELDRADKIDLASECILHICDDGFYWGCVDNKIVMDRWHKSDYDSIVIYEPEHYIDTFSILVKNPSDIKIVEKYDLTDISSDDVEHLEIEDSGAEYELSDSDDYDDYDDYE